MIITMADVAKKLGLSQATVSLALSNSSKVAESTRLKVQAVAKDMGYRVNPYISTLMTARRHGKAPRQPPVLALVSATKTPEQWKERYNISQFISGSTSAAESLGIRIENFWLGEQAMTAERLNSILYNRAIQGAILLPTGIWREKLVHPWENIATVCYSINEYDIDTDWVMSDHFGNMERLLNRLRRYHFRRIGYIMDQPYLFKNINRWLAAYTLWSSRRTLKPWLDPEPSFEGFKEWFTKNRPDVIICVRPATVIEWLKMLNHRVPEDISVVTMCTAEMGGEFSGIDENSRSCGKLALEMLLERIHQNHFGAYAFPHTMTVGGFWNPGKTIRDPAD